MEAFRARGLPVHPLTSLDLKVEPFAEATRAAARGLALGSACVVLRTIVLAAALTGLSASCREPDFYERPTDVGTPVLDVTPSETATPTAVPSGAIPVRGFFRDPRPRDPDQHRTIQHTPSVFGDWDGFSTVIYDTSTVTETNLGHGGLASFSPDSTRVVWAAGEPDSPPGELSLMDLRIGARRRLLSGTGAFIDNETLLVWPADSARRELLDLASGDRRPAPDALTVAVRVRTADGRELDMSVVVDSPYPYLRKLYTLTDPSTGAIVLRFYAYQVQAAGVGELVVATPPSNYNTNIFILDMSTGATTFIATSRWSEPSWPVAANDKYVVWTEAYCGSPPGKTRIFDRRTGRLTEVAESLWVDRINGDLLLAGEFGGTSLIDLATLVEIVALPPRAPDAPAWSAMNTAWSPDLRYGAKGFSSGHGGLCEG